MEVMDIIETSLKYCRKSMDLACLEMSYYKKKK